MYIEKNPTGKKWEPAQGFVTIDDDCVDVPYHDRFTDRDYLLFGFLAGVRDPENQYFKAKGFPSDACKEVKTVYDGYGSDAHTPSYLTLKELRNVDWDNIKIKISRMFLKEQLEKFRESEKNNKPDYNIIRTWCTWASDNENWVKAEIEVPIRHQFSHFYYFMNDLHSYDYRCKDDQIRIVFWFDN